METVARTMGLQMHRRDRAATERDFDTDRFATMSRTADRADS